MALTVEGRDFRSRCEPLGCATRRSNLGVSTAATKKGAFGMTCDSGQARRLTARRSVRLERGTKFALDSLLEEAVLSEPVSSLFAGKIQRIFSTPGPSDPIDAQNHKGCRALRGEFPTRSNRELIEP